MSSNFCRVCHRKLTDVNSVMLGIGPVCRGKVKYIDVKGEEQEELFMERDYILGIKEKQEGNNG